MGCVRERGCVLVSSLCTVRVFARAMGHTIFCFLVGQRVKVLFDFETADWSVSVGQVKGGV